ncbi:MAG: hypothetical protein MJY84_09480, partial [Bacteroidales bacterium]|nr:hypothetical protein [Bacteroidales bacterium]
EFVDPKTTIERKREIARTFNGLKCEFKLKEDAAHPTSPSAIVGDGDSVDYYESAEGCDEGMLFPESGDESLE